MTPRIRAILCGSMLSFLATHAHAGTVSGIVTAASAGSTLPGAVVAAYDVAGGPLRTATTSPAGRYELTVPPGAYRLLAYDPSGFYATVFYGNAESYDTTAVVQVSDAGMVSANFALPAGGTLIGSVLSATAPIAGAVVDAYNLSGTRRGTTVANAAGAFSMVLPPGEFKVFAYDASGVFAGEFAVNARSFEDAERVRILSGNATSSDFLLDRAAIATGTLIDASTLAPLARKNVYVYSDTGALTATTITDPAGHFRFSLAAGQYRFVAGDPSRDYGPAFYLNRRSFERSDVITLGAGEQRSGLTFAAQRGGILSGHVMAASPLTIAAYNLDGTLHATTTTNEAGRFDLLVVPGEYKLAVFDPAGGYATAFYAGATTFTRATPVTVLTGQTTTALNLEPARAGRFTGTVTAVNTGQPLSGMTVVAYDSAETLVARTTTATNGTYTLAMSPGDYRLAAFDTRFEFATAYSGGASSYETSAPRSVGGDQSSMADFVMPRGVRVTGVAREQDGTPVDGIEVFALDAEGHHVTGAVTAGGAFTLVLVPGSYRLSTRDARHRFTPMLSLPFTVGSTSPSAMTLTLTSNTRRRSARS